jgi:hypothetical protein
MTSDEAVQAVVDGLNAIGIPYMVVGSLSTNVYGLPRSTQDADIVVELQSGQIQELAALLEAGFRLDPQPRFETVTMTTYYLMFTKEGKFRIELFVRSDDIHDQTRFGRRVSGMVAGRTVWVPAVEDVIVTKIRWYGTDRRNKDWDDVRNVIAVQQDRLDWDYIHHWCELHGSREHLDAIRKSLVNPQ